jgi:DNA-binding NtrC family response regulator
MDKKTQSGTLNGKAPRVADPRSILIIEDEKLVAWDIEQTLRDHNFQQIMVCSSLRGARSLMQSAVAGISVVILDLKLEDGDGTVLIDEFTVLGIAVLVVTGYSDFEHPRAPVLFKPFANTQLLDAIHSLLDSRH